MSADYLVHFEADAFDVLVLDLELPEPELHELTASERSVALLAADGASNEAIASARRVSVRTVANQLRSVFRKLGVASRWELALLVARRGLAASPPPAPSRPRVAPVPAPRSGIRNSALTVHMLERAHERFGLDFEATLRRRAIERLAGGELAREHYCELFQGLADATGRPSLGLELASSLPPGSLGLLEWVAESAPTLGESLGAASRFGALLHPGGHRELRVAADRVTMSYGVPGLPSPRATIDWSFGYLLHRSRSLVGEQLTPLELHVEYDRPNDEATEAFFGCPVRHGASTNAIVFARDGLERPLRRGDPETFALLATIPTFAVAPSASEPFEHAVWAAIATAIARGIEPRLDRVARRMEVSARTLQRRLSASGHRFDRLVSACRLALALRRLGAGERLEAVESALDEGRDAAFRRALRWLGASAGSWVAF